MTGHYRTMSTILVHSPEEMGRFGERLGRLAEAGSVFALEGDLGAGKTVLSQGVGRALGIAAAITSPTFVVVQEYDGGRLPLLHADLYRVETLAELDNLGLEEALEDEVVGVVEWADRYPEVLPSDHLRVAIRFADHGRTLQCSATGPRHARLLERLFDR